MSEFEAFFSTYAKQYMTSDVDAISAVYEAPLLAVREGRAIHLSDRAAVRGHLTELMAAYKSAGAARADIEEVNAVSLGKSSAMVTVHWHVLDANGGLVRDFHTTYHMLREGEALRILSYTNHDE